MRLFIAINFNDATRTQLLALRNELRSRSNCGRFSMAENLHLTLAFLGECNGQQAAAAKTALEAIKFTPFSIVIDRMGRFKRDDGDIWWAGVQESKLLIDLHRNLAAQLTGAGFPPDNRKYSPHITLGREIVTDAKQRQIEPIGETVTSIELMKSERIGGKLAYSAIYTKEATG